MTGSAPSSRWREFILASTLPGQEGRVCAEEQQLPAERSRRERLWRETDALRAAAGEEIDALFAHMVADRNAVALQAGSCDFWTARTQDTVRPQEAAVFRLAIEEFASSALTRLHDAHGRTIRARTVRPWDLPSLPALTGDGDLDLERSDPLWRGQVATAERILRVLALLAMQDSLEEAVYAHGQCPSQVWPTLWMLYLPGVDWTGLEVSLRREWQNHLFLAEHPGESLVCAARLVMAMESRLQTLPDLVSAVHVGVRGDVVPVFDEHAVRVVAARVEDLTEV